MIMRQSFFFDHNGIGQEEGEYIADTIIGLVDDALKR